MTTYESERQRFRQEWRYEQNEKGYWEWVPRDPSAEVNARALAVELKALAKEMRANSERWFPEMHHLPPVPLHVFYALGLAGEAGEVANDIKKTLRLQDDDLHGLAAELADVFTYLLLLADACAIDIIAAYEYKRDYNEARWGRD